MICFQILSATLVGGMEGEVRGGEALATSVRRWLDGGVHLWLCSVRQDQQRQHSLGTCQKGRCSTPGRSEALSEAEQPAYGEVLQVMLVLAEV